MSQSVFRVKLVQEIIVDVIADSSEEAGKVVDQMIKAGDASAAPSEPQLVRAVRYLPATSYLRNIDRVHWMEMGAEAMHDFEVLEQAFDEDQHVTITNCCVETDEHNTSYFDIEVILPDGSTHEILALSGHHLTTNPFDVLDHYSVR